MSIAFEQSPAEADRAAMEAAALDLVRRRGAELLSVANYYADNPDDAEDAYQRALEILLTKAPSADLDHLLPWMKTVVKHEVFALHRARLRDFPAPGDELESMAGPVEGCAEERAEQRYQLRLGAEALQRLKPQETRALLLKAEGLSYAEICARTGWTYTKVNRCLAEGRQSFLDRVRGIESGAECERMAPLLSALADGEATAEDMLALRPHLRGCAGCRAMLRDYREAPRTVAALAAPVAFVGAGGGGLSAVGGWLSEKAGMAMLRFQSGFEAIAGSKATVVAASTVALAGGGAAAVEEIGSHEPAPKPAVVAAKEPKRVPQAKAGPAPKRAALRVATAYAASVRASERRAARVRTSGSGGSKKTKAASTGAAAVPATTDPGPAEFAPSPDPGAPVATPQSSSSAPAAEPEPAPTTGAPEGDPGGEFGP